MQILDYSAGYPSARAIKAAGYGGVIRYLRKEGQSRVLPITVAELADMRAHGLAVALVYQTLSTDRILAGRAAGEHDARWAQARAAELGAPNAVIYFAADRDILGAGQAAAVTDYLDGAARVIGRDRVGVYGEFDVIEAAVPRHATYGWQTVAWSQGRRSTKAHLFQRAGQPLVDGIAVDVNDVLKANFGQITGTTNTEEDDMALTAAQQQEMYDRITRYADHKISEVDDKVKAALEPTLQGLVTAVKALTDAVNALPQQVAEQAVDVAITVGGKAVQ
jgi:hypothetical protein